MRYRKYIVVFFIFFSLITFSQPFFTSIDSLLIKNFRAVNLRDSVAYMKLVNQTSLFRNKKNSSGQDSLLLLKPFTNAFSDLIASLADMTLNPDVVVSYSRFELMNQKDTAQKNGKIRMHVELIINNTFAIKMPFIATVSNGQYCIDTPMMVMFLEQKE